MSEAQAIILTNEADGWDTARRWEEETPWLVDKMVSELDLTDHDLLLDYGCGVGRLSKGLIDRVGCSVVGVDISPNMRTLAMRSVSHPKFTAMDPLMLGILVRERGLRFSAAISVWVLQHCAKPEDDVGLIQLSLASGGRLFVLNELERRVPTTVGWVDDRKSIPGMLMDKLVTRREGRLAPETASQACRDRTFWAHYEKS